MVDFKINIMIVLKKDPKKLVNKFAFIPEFTRKGYIWLGWYQQTGWYYSDYCKDFVYSTRLEKGNVTRNEYIIAIVKFILLFPLIFNPISLLAIFIRIKIEY